ncbi:MAG: hypothetical protein HY304_06400 [candidate division Zixibacteria bacterium]|nr:hypothetical protein [candidate division Zixibacteria bacterium]
MPGQRPSPTEHRVIIVAATIAALLLTVIPYGMAMAADYVLVSAVLAPMAAQGVSTRQVSVNYSNALGTFNPYIFGTVAGPYYDAAGYPLTQAAGFKLVEVGMNIPVPANPNDPAQYDFSALDQQVSAVLGIEAEPMIVFSRSTKPPDLGIYATYAQNVAKHLTQGWGSGYFWNVSAFRFANEPDNAGFWTGTQTEFFQTYAAWALAMKAVSPAFILDAPALMNAHGTTGPNSLSTWVTGFLSYCQTNGVPVDYFSIHAYAPVPYFSFYDDFRLVQAELQKYPGLSPLYGAPRLANDEWNTLVGDLWSGSYHSQFDTAWVAAHNITALINMVEQGLQLSIRYGGTFNGGTGGCHDFPLTDCNGAGKPPYYAFKGFNRLSGGTRLFSTGTDHMNFAAMAGKGADEVTVVLSNYDVARYLNQYETAGSPAWATYNVYVSLFGTPAVYDSFELALTNLPWTASDILTFQRYVVDDQQQLALVETRTLSGSNALTFTNAMPAPSVQVVRLYRSAASLLPPVYITVVSHNEEPGTGRPDYTADVNYYLANRKLVRQLAETITSRGGKYNFQSDWNYLKAVAMFDTGAVTANTNGKNIVRWMKEDLGVEVDPHAHETQYNYADVAYLIGQLGVTPSKNVGGFLYDPPDNPQGWEKHEAGISGVMYPSYFWRADNLWGAATYLHLGSDDASSGMWRPKDRYNFYVDDTTKHLDYIGGGCGALTGLVQLVDDIQTGKAPSDGFYTANLFMVQDWMDSASIALLGASIDSLAPSVAQGRIQWSTLSQTATTWKAQHAAKASRYTCDTSSTPPATYQIETIETWVTAPNGNLIYARIIRPVAALYPGQRFPALIAIPGGTGPGAPLADNPGYRDLAASGFVVVVFNPEGRGNGLPGNLLSQGVEDCNGFVHQDDLKAIIEYTAGLSDVDSTNIGVETASFGIAIGAGTLGRYPTLPVAYLVDQEGPHDNRVITFYDAGHEVAVCGHWSTVTDPSPANVAFWNEREAVRYIGNFRARYLRMQAQDDHAQDSGYYRHTIEMINAATNTAYGGAGGDCWTRVNGSDIGNPINKTYPLPDTAGYPQWVAGRLSDHPGLNLTYIKEMAALAATGGCGCTCHADPQCDGQTDILDVIQTVNVAFRGQPAITDPGSTKERTDTDCSGATDVVDVVKIVNVAFRAADPAGEFCNPCPAAVAR